MKNNNFIIGDVLKSNYIVLYSIITSMMYDECETFDQAKSFLDYGTNNSCCMPIAIIEGSTNKMVWFEEFLGEEECQSRVDGFLFNYFLVTNPNIINISSKDYGDDGIGLSSDEISNLL